MSERAALRSGMRRMRRGLTDETRRRCARALAVRLAALREFRAARRIAAFVASDGEIDPAPALGVARARGKRVHLPVLAGPAVWFKPWQPATPMTRNRFAIPEPDLPAASRCPVLALDLVLVPLVAFDLAGNRLGMGGGFYDRTFGRLRRRVHWRRPHLIGVAFESQQVSSIDARPWDVPLEAVVTEAAVHRFR